MRKHPNDTDLDFLHTCTKEELEFLVRVIIDAGGKTNGLDKKAGFKMNRSDPTKYVDDIIEEIQLYAGDTIMNRIRGYGVPYREALTDTLKLLGLWADLDVELKLFELEDRLIGRGIPRILEKIKDEKIKSQFQKVLNDPGNGTDMNGDIGFRAWKDTLLLFLVTCYYQLCGYLFHGGMMAACSSPARRVVVPACIYIAKLAKVKNARRRD